MREARAHGLGDFKGFTLVEIMIAMLLFSVALLGIASLATVVINGNNISKQVTTSTTLAQQKLEDYLSKGYGYGNYTTGTITENYGTIPDSDGNTALYTGYKRVTVVQNGPAVNTRKLMVTVYRKNNNNSSAVISTIVAK